MDCSMIKALRGRQVGQKSGLEQLVPVELGGRRIWTLVDKGCGHTLVWREQGPWSPEVLMCCSFRGDGVHLSPEGCDFYL